MIDRKKILYYQLSIQYFDLAKILDYSPCRAWKSNYLFDNKIDIIISQIEEYLGYSDFYQNGIFIAVDCPTGNDFACFVFHFDQQDPIHQEKINILSKLNNLKAFC